MTTLAGLAFRNGECVPVEAVPKLSPADFRAAVLQSVRGDSRLVAIFGERLPDARLRLYAVLADDARHQLSLLATAVGTSFEALTPDCPQAHMFEREIWEQHGIMPEGHPWLKPVRVHDDTYRYFSMSGEEVHEVAVGPVHAGVIEPGHFRFQCQGETVHHLEIHLGYQHRGVEEALIGGPHRRTMAQMETVAGDTTVGHATAYSMLLESLGHGDVSPRAHAIRAIALELERVANHAGDLGALANDVGYLPTAAYCGCLRGDALNMSGEVCGSRLGRSLVRPVGVQFDIDTAMAADLLTKLERFEADFKSAADLLFNTRSVLDRLQGSGIVSAQACRDLGFVGLTARASGVPRDLRTDHPTGWWSKAAIPVAIATSGDVFARAMVRRLEIERSLAWVKDQLRRLPDGPIMSRTATAIPDRIAVALVEGWRGEVAHVGITSQDGRFARYKIVDPSFHNWTALALALRGLQISDFPLNNKSFNLSYCGFDL